MASERTKVYFSHFPFQISIVTPSKVSPQMEISCMTSSTGLFLYSLTPKSKRADLRKESNQALKAFGINIKSPKNNWKSHFKISFKYKLFFL